MTRSLLGESQVDSVFSKLDTERLRRLLSSMAGSCNSIRCKVNFEKEALSIRHYILPVDDPNNDADFYDRLVAKVDQDIVKAKSEAITQPCFTLYWTGSKF